MRKILYLNEENLKSFVLFVFKNIMWKKNPLLSDLEHQQDLELTSPVLVVISVCLFVRSTSTYEPFHRPKCNFNLLNYL